MTAPSCGSLGDWQAAGWLTETLEQEKSDQHTEKLKHHGFEQPPVHFALETYSICILC